jgi:UDP-glucose 4-epimerase
VTDVLVTGGAGFIGSHLVDALVRRGDAVTVLDDLSTGREANLADARARGARLRLGDVSNAETVRDAVAAATPELVFHLAAQIDVRRAVAEPTFDARVNVLGTINVLESARTSGVARLVLVSTGGALYGDAGTVPSSEAEPVAPLSPYGQSKAAAEGYCALFARLHGLSTVALRLANVYGPRQRPALEGGVVARFCDLALAGQAFTVYGDGRQTRDLVFVGDVVAALLAAAGRAPTDALNVGTGEQTSVLELAAAVARAAGRRPVLEHLPARAGEVTHSALDARRAARELDWRPRVGLDEGIARTLRWARAARPAPYAEPAR